MGKGVATQDQSSVSRASSHSAAPMSTLKDPASFGPPPKHIAVHGQDGVDANRQRQPPPKPARPSQATPAPPTPLREQPREAPSPTQRTGTGNRVNNYGESIISPDASQVQQPTFMKKPKPPPRLPARQTEHPGENAPEPPPTYGASQYDRQVNSEAPPQQGAGYINQDATRRLGRAGVSVPGFNIGESFTQSPQSASAPSRPPLPSRQLQSSQSSNQNQFAGATPSDQVSELQSRFASMGRRPSVDEEMASPSAAAPPSVAAVAAKKAPPKPPPKKASMASNDSGGHASGGAPPPIPTASKPR